MTLERTPEGATYWSTRGLAAQVGLSHQSVARNWQALGLQPSCAEVFSLSSDSNFVPKVRDVVRLYLNLPGQRLRALLQQEYPMPAAGVHPTRVTQRHRPYLYPHA